MIHTHTCFVHFSCFVSIDTFQILIFIIIWNRKKHNNIDRHAICLCVCFIRCCFCCCKFWVFSSLKKWMNEEDFFIWSFFCCWKFIHNVFSDQFYGGFSFDMRASRLKKKNFKKIFWILKFFSKSKILWIFGFFFRKVTTRLPQIFRRKNH